MPPCASGPVFTVSRPSLNGAACAIAGAGNLKVAAAAPATVPAINLRREILRDIKNSSLCAPCRGCFIGLTRILCGPSDLGNAVPPCPTAADLLLHIIGQAIP